MVQLNGLQRRSTYEEVAREVQLDRFKDLIKPPDRLPKTILDAPTLTSLDPENEETINQYEKNKRVEQARRSAAEEVAQSRGVSRAQMELATRPSPPQLVEPTFDYQQRRSEIQLAEAASNFNVATTQAANVERARTLLRQHLHEVNRSAPEYHIGTPDGYSTPEEIDLHLPETPSAMEVAGSVAGGVAGLAVAGATTVAPIVARSVHNATPQAINALYEAARLTSAYGPSVARATMQAAGYSAQAVELTARGLINGGVAAGNVMVAAGQMTGALAPASHRGHDFMRANGVSFQPHITRLLAEHRVF
jgi:hypothetical protein